MKKLVTILAVVLVFAGFQTPVSAQEHGKPPVEELEKKFRDLIYQETVADHLLELKNYDSMARLEEDFKGIMTWPLADHFLERFFYEENENVYVKGQDGPITLNTEEDYSLEKISDSKYQLTQSSADELRGGYTLTITYSYEAGRWVFADRMDILGETETGGELPNTASSNPAMILFGMSLTGAGALMMMRRRFVSK